MEHESLLSISQDPANCPNPEPDESNPRSHTLSVKDTFQYYRPVYVYVFKIFHTWACFFPLNIQRFNPLAPDFFFLILAHPVYKM